MKGRRWMKVWPDLNSHDCNLRETERQWMRVKLSANEGYVPPV